MSCSTNLEDWDPVPEPVKPPVMTLRLEIASRLMPTVIEFFSGSASPTACGLIAIDYADALIKAEGDRK